MEKKQEAPVRGARLVLVLGGARSGKSAFAERLAASSRRPVAFIATATAGDEEMRARIERHRAARPRHWPTIEEPLDLAAALRQASSLADVLLLDCITLWVSNCLLSGWHAEIGPDALFASDMLARVAEVLAVLESLPAEKTLIAVTNEVGLGLVPEYPLGRVYRDTLGSVNQRFAGAARHAYFLVAGIAVDLKRFQEEAWLD